MIEDLKFFVYEFISNYIGNYNSEILETFIYLFLWKNNFSKRKKTEKSGIVLLFPKYLWSLALIEDN